MSNTLKLYYYLKLYLFTIFLIFHQITKSNVVIFLSPHYIMLNIHIKISLKTIVIEIANILMEPIRKDVLII